MDGTSNIVPRMAPKALQEGYEQILKHIYSPENYYQRVKTFLREYKTPKIRTPLTVGRLLALGAFDAPAGHHRQGTLSVLEADDLDDLPPAAPAAAGRHADDLRPSLPQGGREERVHARLRGVPGRRGEVTNEVQDKGAVEWGAFWRFS